MKSVITTLLIAALLLIAGTVAFIYSGVYNVGATSPHGAVSSWILETTMHASVERHAAQVDAPDLEDRALVLAGANDFEAMCAQCHGAPGQEPAALGKGLNPPAPDLSESAKHMTAAELFWVTKHGIRMTGMPAWGATHEDDALWPVVAFLRELPELEAAAYAELLESAEGMGHHTGDDHAPAAGEEPGADAEHGHSTHEH